MAPSQLRQEVSGPDLRLRNELRHNSVRPTSFEPIDARGAKAGLLMVRSLLALAVSEE